MIMDHKVCQCTNCRKNRGREIIPLKVSLAVRKVTKFFMYISELLAVIKEMELVQLLYI